MNPMNPKLVPILQRIIQADPVLRSFEPDNLPLAGQHYVRKNYLFAEGATEEEYNLLDGLPVYADVIRESFRADESADASRFHLFEDGSLLVVTNAFQQVWADARDYAVECILPRMELTRMEAELLRAIGMDDAVESVRDDFFHAFAESLHRKGGIPHSEARGHWSGYSRHLPFHQVEELEFGGHDRGEAEARDYLEWCRSIA